MKTFTIDNMTVQFRTLNWNKRNQTVKFNRGSGTLRDKSRRAPRLSNGRWIPINSSGGSLNDW